MVHKGSDVSIGTQTEEESMQGGRVIETTDKFKAHMERNYDFQNGGSEVEALIKYKYIDRQSIKVCFVEHQLMSAVTSEPKERILIRTDDREHSQTKTNQMLEIMMTKDANELW